MRKLAIAILVLLLVLLIFWCLFQHSPVVEEHVEGEVGNALSAIDVERADVDFSQVTVDADIRNVVLSGNVGSEQEKQLAGKVAAETNPVDLWPASWVDNNIVVAAAEPAPAPTAAPTPVPAPVADYETRFNLDKERLVITGMVPSENSRQMIMDKLKRQFDGREIEIVDQMKVETRGVPDTWGASTDAIIKRLSNFDSGDARIFNKEVSVDGMVGSDALKQQTVSGLNAELSGRTQLTLNINAPAAEKQAAINCQKEFNDILAKGTILFNTDSDVIKPVSYPLLSELAAEFEKCPASSVDILGHTDSVGNEAYNMQLSQRRAAAVTRYLSSKGVDVSRITSIGRGEEAPIADNATKEGRAKNRRIEFKVKGV